MNENLNLIEILKDCPKGTKLYSTVLGEVKFESINEDKFHPIVIKFDDNYSYSFSVNGKMFENYDGECTLFPSKEQRDWSKFKVKKPKFDPKTLQPFDKVLVRSDLDCIWVCEIFSHISKLYGTVYFCGEHAYQYCIPYNDDTKHLIGKDDEASEFYRYWED